MVSQRVSLPSIFESLISRPENLNCPLGCDFVIPIRGYADTRKKLRSFFLFAIILSRIRFVKFCQTGDFVARIPGYTLQNDHFLSVYSFIRIRSTNSPSTWKGYSFVFGMLRIRGRQKSLFSYPKFAKKPTPTLTLQRGIK